jgi:ABC-type branched-subunit amino acid transport system ATPase component
MNWRFPSETPGFEIVNFELGENEILGFNEPNGAGNTVRLNISPVF